MKDGLLTRDHKIFALVAIVYILLFGLLPHTELLPADPGLKILQVRDFIRSDFSTFQAYYPGRSLDPEGRFFPVKAPFAYAVGDAFYYVFPFFLTLLYTPLYLLGGVYALELLSLAAGLGTVWLLLLLGRQFDLSAKASFWMVLCFALGSSVPAHSLMPGEMMIATFFVTLSVYLIIRGGREDRRALFLLAGLACGCSALVRIETALAGALLALFVWFAPVAGPARRRMFVPLLLGLGSMALVLGGVNYWIVGNVLGLRGIQVEVGMREVALLDRFGAFVSYYLFSCSGLGLFVAWPALLSFFAAPWVFRSEPASAVRGYAMSAIFAIVAIYCVAIPLLVTHDDGSIYGPRYIMPVQALLTLLAFVALDRLVLSRPGQRRWAGGLARIAVIYQMVLTALAIFVLFQFNRASRELNERVESEVQGSAVVLRSWELYGTVLALMADRPVLAADSSDAAGTAWQESGGAVAACRAGGHKRISVVQFEGEPETVPRKFFGCPAPAHRPVEVIHLDLE